MPIHGVKKFCQNITKEIILEVEIKYQSPRENNKTKFSFNARLSLFSAKNRSQTSSYRLKWDNQFAIQLAKDYPKSL